MYLFRALPAGPLVPHQPDLHGYACDYVGGDEGPTMIAAEYRLSLDRGEQAVFLNTRTGKYYAAVRIGEPSMFPYGDNWRQWQAHIVLCGEVFQSGGGLPPESMPGPARPSMWAQTVAFCEWATRFLRRVQRLLLPGRLRHPSLPTAVQTPSEEVSGGLTSMVGPFTFYNLVFALEAGAVTPQEATSAGYFGEAICSLRGHVQELSCSAQEEALALLALLS